MNTNEARVPRYYSGHTHSPSAQRPSEGNTAVGAAIRVLLCDDHALLRAGLRALLSQQPDLLVVGEVGTAEEAVEQACTCSPDVVVMDISLPGMSGLDATRQIVEQRPDCRVLVVTMHNKVYYLLGALKAGASGYVLKSDVNKELVDAIRMAHRGEAFVYSADTRVFFRAYLERGDDLKGPERLSEMENRVMRLTVRGHTSEEIAQLLHISPSTVDTYRGRIMSKLGLNRRSQLVQWALEQGLLTTA